MASENQQSLPAMGPVSTGDRIDAIDTLRGVALLGILTINITAYALPFAAYFNPQAAGGATGINLVMWFFSHILFESKMMAIFSMLFGAGMILMYERAQAAGRPFRGVYYRRILWLMVIGLVHAYVFWYGDILVTYAVCGLLLYLFRRRSPRTLIILGLLVLLIGAGLRTGSGYSFSSMQEQANKLDEAIATGYEPSAGELAFRRNWDAMRRGFAPAPEEVEEDARKMRGDAGTVLKTNAAASVMMHAQALPFMLLWRGLSMMLLGMGLMKLGVFSAERSRRFYTIWTILGFGIGLPIVAYGAFRLEAHDFDFIRNFFIDGHFNYFGSVLVAMGFVSLVMLLYKSGVLGGLRARLAAVGRMALTNYLMQTVICVLIFYGYGLGLFGRIDRTALWLFVIGIWVIQLIISPWWLARYRFGPAEWLWRSLTYGKRQPFRISS